VEFFVDSSQLLRHVQVKQIHICEPDAAVNSKSETRGLGFAFEETQPGRAAIFLNSFQGTALGSRKTTFQSWL
jgi:hypothetical protein